MGDTIKSMAAKRKHRIALILLLVMVTLYVGSYMVLSRRGIARAELNDSEGFHFFPPENTNSWRRKNAGCIMLYMPLIWLEYQMGTGLPIASEPLWNLS